MPSVKLQHNRQSTNQIYGQVNCCVLTQENTTLVAVLSCLNKSATSAAQELVIQVHKKPTDPVILTNFRKRLQKCFKQLFTMSLQLSSPFVDVTQISLLQHLHSVCEEEIPGCGLYSDVFVYCDETRVVI